MKTYIALLRGINVSGHKMIKMAELKVMFEKNDFKDVKTYIQSGNIVFKTKESIPQLSQQTIKKAILNTFGFNVDVQVLSSEKLIRITEKHSFLRENEDQIKSIYYTFMAEKPAPELIDELNKIEQTTEFFKITDEVIYCFYPNGLGRSKLHGMFFEKKLKVSCTTRNYNTVKKLVELSGKDE